MKQTYLLTFLIEFYEFLSVLKETKCGEKDMAIFVIKLLFL